MSADDVLWDAEIAADLADLFIEARERAVQHDAEVLILVNSSEGLECWTNTPPAHAAFLAQTYITKAVLEAFPSPLETDDGD